VSDESGSLGAEHRKYPRYRVHWKVLIVHEQSGTRQIFKGRTHDLSIKGASIYSDHNIFVEGKVTVYLVMPTLDGDLGEKVIEIESRMVYTVLASNQHQFRIGLHFLKFKGNGHRLLSENLARRSTVAI
jgi:c-di-GMP-binding flagellar brake protein YcgR